MTRQPRRYTVRPALDNEATLRVLDGDGPLGDKGTEVEYWAPVGGGYLRAVTPARSGLLGEQVCDQLSNRGPTIFVAEGVSVAAVVRIEARLAYRAWDRECAL